MMGRVIGGANIYQGIIVGLIVVFYGFLVVLFFL
jgi:hypothetical protein